MFHLTHHKWLHRVAVVSDADWVGALSRAVAHFYPAEIRTFKLAQLGEARTWARVGNVAKAAA